MAYFANNALTYKNKDGVKTRRKAGAIFDDATDVDLEIWMKRGNAREASVGEVAEAVAAGLYDCEVVPPKKAAGKTKKDADGQNSASRSDLV